MTDPDGVTGVLETCLYAEDLDASASFYESLLGLEPVSKVAGRHVFFRCGAGMFLLFDPAGSELPGSVPTHGARGPGHVAFALPTGSVEVWRERFKARGIPIERDLDWPNGGRSLYVRDPAGNSVELATPGLWGMLEDALEGGPSR